MKKLLLAIIILGSFESYGQKIENIYANLYTDSLKKGTHNYINIDGELSNGKYIPLDSNRIIFWCDQAVFFGNSLYIPADFVAEKVTVKISLKADSTKVKIFDLYIKKLEDPPLKSEAEVLSEIKKQRKKTS